MALAMVAWAILCQLELSNHLTDETLGKSDLDNASDDVPTIQVTQFVFDSQS